MKRECLTGIAAVLLLSGRAAATEVSPSALIQVDTNHVESLNADGSRAGLEADRTKTDIRRATIGLEGELGQNMAWEVAYDVEGRVFRDVFAVVTWRQAHSLVAGQFKQPVLMDELSSSRTADFIASSTIADVFAVSRRAGISYRYRAEHGGAAISFFGRELGNGGDSGRGGAGRVFLSPRQWEDGFLHLGASVSSTNDTGSARYRVRPNADLLSLRFLDVRSARPCAQCEVRVDVAAPEVALVRGPWKLQSEVLRARARQRAGADASTRDAVDARGGYVSLMWMPGHQRWSYRNGLIVTPRPADGESLWQLGVRYDWTSLDPDGRDGLAASRLRVATAGMNWYVGQRWKLSFNVLDARARRSGNSAIRSTVAARILESRLQFAW